MKSRLLNRTWISPITSVTFLVVGVTGILMAFHVKNGGIKALHEWIGYAFTLAAVIHLVVNWRSFLSHFRERSAILAVCGGIILSLAGLLVPIPLMALDLLTGAVQAYIFAVLATVFLGAAVGEQSPSSPAPPQKETDSP